ncbi:MAG: hypothetical protein E7378_00100 [Clostridiales bacterium]|nr:hypothetical protein [Clostridiales bacterium]
MSEKEPKKSIWDKIPFLQKLKNIKHIGLLVIGIFVIVLILIYISSSSSKKSTELPNSSEFNSQQYAQYLENKLIEVLDDINGVGKVSAMITLDGGMNYEYATESEEVTTTSQSGNSTNTKTTIDEKVVMVSINGKQTPLVIKSTYPKIVGVVVVAQGANNAQIKLNIARAIETLLDVSDSNVEILVGAQN